MLEDLRLERIQVHRLEKCENPADVAEVATSIMADLMLLNKKYMMMFQAYLTGESVSA